MGEEAGVTRKEAEQDFTDRLKEFISNPDLAKLQLRYKPRVALDSPLLSGSAASRNPSLPDLTFRCALPRRPTKPLPEARKADRLNLAMAQNLSKYVRESIPLS